MSEENREINVNLFPVTVGTADGLTRILTTAAPKEELARILGMAVPQAEVFAGQWKVRKRTGRVEKPYSMRSCRPLLIAIGSGLVRVGSVSERGETVETTIIHTYS